MSALGNHAPVSAFIDKKTSLRIDLNNVKTTPKALQDMKARAADLRNDKVDIHEESDGCEVVSLLYYMSNDALRAYQNPILHIYGCRL